MVRPISRVFFFGSTSSVFLSRPENLDIVPEGYVEIERTRFRKENLALVVPVGNLAGELAYLQHLQVPFVATPLENESFFGFWLEHSEVLIPALEIFEVRTYRGRADHVILTIEGACGDGALARVDGKYEDVWGRSAARTPTLPYLSNFHPGKHLFDDSHGSMPFLELRGKCHRNERHQNPTTISTDSNFAKKGDTYGVALFSKIYSPTSTNFPNNS